MSEKNIVIGLDSACFDLIHSYIKEEKLPTFKKLIGNGVAGNLKTTIPPLTPCAWSSFMTGMNPGKHGMLDFYHFDKDMNIRVNTAKNRKGKSIWRTLSDNGYRCIVYNVPFTYPSEEIDGIMISGFDTPNLESNFTHPREFKDVFLKEFPNYKISEESRYTERLEDKLRFIDELHELVELNYDVAEWLMDNYEWDFFMFVVMSIDHVQHWFWKYMDETHPGYEDNADEKLKNAILGIYQHVDSRLGEFLKKMPEEANLFIMSDHGAGPNIKSFYPNIWLLKNGYLKFKNAPKTLLKRFLYAMGITPEFLIRIWLKLGAKQNKSMNLSNRASVLNKIGISLKDIDWNKTKIFSYGYYGGFYIIDKNNTRTKLIKEITEKLAQLEDPEIQEKLLTDLWLRDDIFWGDDKENMPDILYSLKNFAYTSSQTMVFPSNKVFSSPVTFKSGDHRLDGIFIAYGKNIKKSFWIERATIFDIAPTVLALFGVQKPIDIDGRILDEIFKKEVVAVTKVKSEAEKIREIIRKRNF